MAVYLGHTTARRILESKLALELEPMPYHTMINCESGKRAVTNTIRAAYKDKRLAEPLARNFLCRSGEPLDVLTDDRTRRHSWLGGQIHLVDSKMPSGSFMQLEPGIFVASPALCLVQLASSLSLLEIIQLAMSFCGIYQLVGDEHRQPYERRPLTTPKEIMDYLSAAKAMHGIARVQEAMPWVISNSGSQMETKMALSMYLPLDLGGYGLPMPEMNARVHLSAEMRKMIGQSNCFGDAIWSEKGFEPLDMEYQSYEHHLNAEKYGEDIARQLAIQHEGYTVQFVTKRQLDNHDELNELARLVAAHTGAQLPKSAFAWPQHRVDQHEALMATF